MLSHVPIKPCSSAFVQSRIVFMLKRWILETMKMMVLPKEDEGVNRIDDTV